MISIRQLSEAIIGKVSLLPNLDRENEMMVGSRTRRVGFEPDYLTARYGELIAVATDVDKTADVIISRCSELDYYYKHEKLWS